MTANWNGPVSSDSFIVVCKNAYLSHIHPFDNEVQVSDCYQRLNFISTQYGLRDFTGFLLGDQYYINLWASYFILEEFKPEIEEKLIGLNDEKSIIEDCIETCERYAQHFKDKFQSENYNIWIRGIRDYYNL